MTQEKEILEKEKKISTLNDSIKKETERWLVKKKETDQLGGLELQASFTDILCLLCFFFRLVP